MTSSNLSSRRRPWRAAVRAALVLLGLALGYALWIPSPAPTAKVSAPPPERPATADPEQSPALAALRAGDLAGARRLARQALSDRPGDAESHRILSEVEFAIGDYDTALAAANEALRISGEDERVLFTAVRSQWFVDPARALDTARKLVARDRGSLANRILVAELQLYQASASGFQGQEAAAAARKARKSLGRGPGRPEDPMAGDYLAVQANSYLLEGDLARAKELLRKALDTGTGMPDRLTDLAEALAWVNFRTGDEAGMRAAYERALAILRTAPPDDAFQFLPKWENFLLMRYAFAGVPTSVEEARALRPLRGRLRKRGYQDQLTFREDRQLYTALADAVERKDYPQAFYLLAWRALPLPQDAEADPRAPLLPGEKRLEPGCFYRVTVAVPSEKVFRPMLLGRVAEAAGRRRLARFWYERALAEQPGNAIIESRLAGLPSEPPSPGLGAPDVAQTVLLLHRLAENGWAGPLYLGLQNLQAQGTTLREFDEMVREKQPPFLELLASLAAARQAIERGASIKEEHLAQPIPEEEWSERAEISIAGAPPVIMHKEDRLWLLTELPPPGPGRP